MKKIKNMSEIDIEKQLIEIDINILPSYVSGIKNTLTLAKILHHRIKFGPAIYKFCDGLTDDNFSFQRFAQYQEYRSIKKTDSYSETYYRLKYGNEWKPYYKSRISTRPNPYDIKHYTSKGSTVEEATKQILELKEKTTPKIEKYIKKYGGKLGVEKFNEGCRRHKNYLEYWIKHCNGDIKTAEQSFENYKKTSSPKCIDFYLKKGYSQEAAEELISKHQLSNAGVHRQYYENKGYSLEEIDIIMEEINKRKDSSSINFIRSNYPHEDTSKFYEHYNRSKSSRYREVGVLAKDDPRQSERDAYYTAVRYYTRISSKLLCVCPGVSGKNIGNYHIDHIFSVAEGFRNKVNPKIIGSVVNLQWLLCEENTSKRARCDITLEELLRKYKDHENYKN